MVFISLLLFVAILPNRVDGDLLFQIELGRKGGDPLLVIDDVVLIQRGRGPSEIEPVNMDYDFRSRRAYFSDGYKIFLYDIQKKSLETLNQKKWQTHRGTWGEWHVIFCHDYMRDKTKGGRLILRDGDQEVLLAHHTADHSNMHSLVWFVREKHSLVILDNFARSIGYLPLNKGKITIADGAASDIKWFPMPAEVRETPIYLKPHEVKENNFLLYGSELEPGLFMLTSNTEKAYLYDLANTSSYYLGHLVFDDAIAGKNPEGKLMVNDLDTQQIIEFDPLPLVAN